MPEAGKTSGPSNAVLFDAAKLAGVAAVLALPLLGFRLNESAQGLTLGLRLSWVLAAAALVFLGRLAFAWRRSISPRPPVTRKVQALPLNETFLGRGLAVFALAMPLLPFADRNLVDVATLILIYVMLGVGLNVVVGLAGLLDLGYVAFYAVGAYSYALLSHTYGISFWLCLPLAGLIAAAFGLILGLPILQLRGDYLAIVTLGFGEIVHVVLVNWTPVTGGPNGIAGIARPTFLGLPFLANAPDGQITFAQYFGISFSPMQRVYFFYYLILIMALLTMLFVSRIRRLPLGRAWEALREDETACLSLGLNPTLIKLSAFALGAGIAGLAGAFFATRQGFISPESFTFVESAMILAIVVLGGMGNQLGVAVAAILLVGLPEWFRGLDQFRMLAFGIAMVLIMLWQPRGLAAKRRPTVLLNGIRTKIDAKAGAA